MFRLSMFLAHSLVLSSVVTATTPAEWTAIKDERARARVLTEVKTTVANRMIDAFLSPIDVKKRPKSADVRARDLKRAEYVATVVKTPDPTGQLAVRLMVARTENPHTHMENVIGRFIMDGVLRLEAEEAARKQTAKQRPHSRTQGPRWQL